MSQPRACRDMGKAKVKGRRRAAAAADPVSEALAKILGWIRNARTMDASKTAPSPKDLLKQKKGMDTLRREYAQLIWNLPAETVAPIFAEIETSMAQETTFVSEAWAAALGGGRRWTLCCRPT